MQLGSQKRLARYLMSLGTLVIAVAAFGQSGGSKPMVREDLRAYGLGLVAGKLPAANYTDVVFLSDNLVLVTVNMRQFAPVSPLFADKPLSTLLLFDLSQKRLLRSAQLRVEKWPGSIRATQNGYFALLDEDGVRICSVTLECGQPFATEGPLLASPRGTRLVAGGNGQTAQKLLDSATLKEIGSFPYQNPTVIPGDRGLLLRYGPREYLRFPGKPDFPIKSDESSSGWVRQFLNEEEVVGFTRKEVAVAGVDGRTLYSLPVKDIWNVEFATSAGGTRFCIHEWGYTRWNSVVNFYDINEGRPPNLEKVRVVDAGTGKSLFEMKWDPRPYWRTTPALSPDGHRIAIVRQGDLEIFEIP